MIFAMTGKYLAVMVLGLGTAMHFVVGIIAVLWLVLEWRQGRLQQWVTLIPLFLLFGVLPYTLTLWELWQENGVLNLRVLLDFTNNTSGAGGLMVTQLPERLLRYAAWVTASLGVALVPIVYGLKQRKVKGYGLMLTPIAFVSWYYLTAQDPTVWHYLPWTIPFLSVFSGLGIVRLRKWKPLIPAVVLGTVMLLAANAVIFNADKAAHQHPVATIAYNNIKALPKGAVVASGDRGVGTTLRYVIATERPDIRRAPPANVQKEMERGNDVYIISADTLEVSKILHSGGRMWQEP